MTDRARFLTLKVALRMVVREFYAGRLRRDEALDLVAEFVDKYRAGEALILPAEHFFPAWCEVWRRSHSEPELPQLDAHRGEGRAD